MRRRFRLPIGSREVSSLIAASTMRTRSCCATLALVLTALAGWLFPVGTLCAQKPDPLAGEASGIKAMLRAGEITDEKTFEDFFKKYYFKQFVAPTRPYSLDDLSRLRKELKSQYFLVPTKAPAAHARLNELALETMKQVLSGKYGQYDSAIKYNALLVIGDLNEKEADPGKANAKPYPAALPVLMLAAHSAKFKDYMKVAGLIGLERFAAARAIPQAKSAELTTSLLAIVNQQAPPANRTPEAHNWIRRSAGQVLASLGNPGPGNSVVKAFEAIVANPEVSPTMRCEFAQFFGQLKYPPTSKTDLSALSNLLGHMAADICQQELDSAKLANRAPSRRLVMYSLYSVAVGISANSSAKSGLFAAAEGSPHKEFIDKVNARVKTLYQWIDDPKFDDAELAVELGDKINDLETVLIAKPTAKLVSEQTEKPADPVERQNAARAAVDTAKVPPKN